MSPRTILAIHPGALGDVLLAVPALRELRRADREARVVLAAQPRVGALLEALGLVDRHGAFDGLGLDALFVEDRSLRPSAWLSEAGSVVCWFGSGDPVFVCRLGETVPGAVVASPRGPDGALVWEHLVATVGGKLTARGWGRLAVDDAALRAPLVLPEHLAEAGRRTLLDAGWDGISPLFLLHPGAGGEGKRWPAAAFAAVVAALTQGSPMGESLAVAIHAGPADHAAAAEMTRRLASQPGRRGVPIVLREPELGTLAGALGQVRLYLGNDSGVSHLAAAVGAPSVVLFMQEHLRWLPWSAAARPVVVSRQGGEGEAQAVLTASRAVLDETAGRRGRDRPEERVGTVGEGRKGSPESDGAGIGSHGAAGRGPAVGAIR